MKRLVISFAALAAVALGATIPPPGAPVPPTPGTGLVGQIWQFVDSNGDPAEAGWTSLAEARTALGVGANPPNATFLATTLDYNTAAYAMPNSSFVTVNDFLGADAASLSNAAFGLRQLRSVYIRFTGFVAIPMSPVTQVIEFGTGSDDGIILRIKGLDVSGYDGNRSFGSEAGDAEFAEGGLYPIEIEYFNAEDDGAAMRILWDPEKDGSQNAIPVANLYAIPEPGTWVAAATGLAILALRARRRA